MELLRVGEVKIVSSGYTDRYLSEAVHLIIREIGVSYRIDHRMEWEQAYSQLKHGQTLFKLPKGKQSKIYWEIEKSPLKFYGTLRIKGGYWTTEMSPNHITAGIKIATGYPNLSEYGINEVKKIESEITPVEWEFVRQGLESINRKHREENKPIVEFDIPKESLTKEVVNKWGNI